MMTSPNFDSSAASAPATSPGALRAAVIAHPQDGVPIRAFGNEILFELSTEQTGGALVVGLATVPPGGVVPPHVQEREDELFLIVEGEYRFWVDGAQTDVGPGALVYMPRGVPHKLQVLGKSPGRHWVISAPGGFDRLFAQCAEVFAAPGPPDFARIAAIKAEYGMRFV
jgi:mannose-6-phosphate isomerase-like protein (cupin superfamily)